jgi:hypothetical protein
MSMKIPRLTKARAIGQERLAALQLRRQGKALQADVRPSPPTR